ncbi:Cro/CI family transcriptional regulator [Acinetobacter baumannii]|nr:Cro/CI family transcriptional regulator [Acinetobacter baumannii]
MSLHTRIRQKLEEKKLRAADLARATKKMPQYTIVMQQRNG